MKKVSILAAIALLILTVFVGVHLVQLHQVEANRSFFDRTETKIDMRQQLTGEELQRMEAFCNSLDMNTRAKAITVLSFSRDAPGRVAAIQMAESHLSDKEFLVRNAALNALRREKSPDLFEQAQRMLHDPAPQVSSVARRVLSAERTP